MALIFHGQGVVGLSQERAEPGFSLQHCLPGGGVGEPSVHFQPDSPVNIRPQQCLRRGPQGVCVPALTAEIEGFHPTLGQEGYAAVCEFLRRGHGPGSGQLYHQIGPAAHGHLRPGKFLHTGCAAPLGEVAAHGAHQHPAAPTHRPGAAAPHVPGAGGQIHIQRPLRPWPCLLAIQNLIPFYPIFSFRATACCNSEQKKV